MSSASNRLVGGAAIASVVIGCGWLVYSNILSASVYPTLGTAGYDEPVVKLPKLASRAVSDAFAALPDATTIIEKPATVAAISSIMFNERFAAAAPQSVASNAANAQPPAAAPQLAEAVKPPAFPKLAEASKKEPAPAKVAMATPPSQPGPRAAEAPAKPQGTSIRDMAQRAKAAVMSIASNERASIVDRLWGKESSSKSSLLAYASADTSSITASISRDQDPTAGGQAPYDRDTAVYDITAHTVYLPDGTRLEAHSGLGSNLDDPRSEKIRMRGVTPPHIYTLKPRESLFHGVAALRLTPIGGEDAIHGRDGILAHTFMLGPNGDSNGCVSFRDYNAFLEAYRNKGIRKIAVLARVQ